MFADYQIGCKKRNVTYSCELCKKLFLRQSVFKRHKRVVHITREPADTKKSKTCSICNKPISRAMGMTRHTKKRRGMEAKTRQTKKNVRYVTKQYHGSSFEEM